MDKGTLLNALFFFESRFHNEFHLKLINCDILLAWEMTNVKNRGFLRYGDGMYYQMNIMKLYELSIVVCVNSIFKLI